VTDGWLLATGIADLAATPVYGYVGFRLYQRPVPTPARLPATQFSIWWWGIGVTAAIGGVEGTLASIGALHLTLGLTFYLLTVLVDAVTLWGLVGYLVYLYTGRYHLVALSAFYAAFYVVTLYWIIAGGPSGISLASGTPAVTESHALGGVIVAFVLFGLLGPELVAMVLYASLLRKVSDRTLRYRIAVVTVSLLLFFLVAFIPGAGGPRAFVEALFDVLSAIVAFVAFFPPAALQRALGVSAVPREEPGPEGFPPPV
jgi:hypothetical protein